MRLMISALFLAMVLPAFGCGTPWVLVAKSSQNELRATAQLRDRRLRSELRKAIAIAEPSQFLNVSPYVFMEHGFVVGALSDADMRQPIEAAARSVTGLRTITVHLPIRDSNREESDLALALEVRTRLTARLDIAKSRVSVMALNGRIVILGILEHAEQTRVIEAIEGVAGITGIDNFMLVPEAGYARRREGLR